MIVTILFTGWYGYSNFIDTNVYQNSREYEDFVDRALYEKELFKTNSNAQVEYDYEEPFATAVRKDTETTDSISAFRDHKIKARIKECKKMVSLEESEDLTHACIVDTSVHSSGNGADSLVIYTKFYEEQDRKMVLRITDVQTYLFSHDMGKELEPLQALNVNFRAKASKFAKEYFEKTFGEERLKEDWKDYISDSDDNYNKFILTGNTVIFFFNEDTVLDPSYGTVTLKIPYQYMQLAIRPKVLDRYIDPNKPMVAVTFDDGPGGKSETRILECLEKYGAVATFFYQGMLIDDFGYNAVKAAEIGCEIGNHSWDHPMLSSLSKKKMRSQIERTNEAIKNATGIKPDLIRPPYGDFNKKVNGVIKSEDMASVLWTVDTRDWESRNPKKIFKSVKKVKKLDGKIILMHSIYNETAKATEKIIPWLVKNGYQTVTVSELVKYKTGKLPKAGDQIRTIH